MNKYIDPVIWSNVVNSLNTGGYHVPRTVSESLLDLIASDCTLHEFVTAWRNVELWMLRSEYWFTIDICGNFNALFSIACEVAKQTTTESKKLDDDEDVFPESSESLEESFCESTEDAEEEQKIEQDQNNSNNNSWLSAINTTIFDPKNNNSDAPWTTL